MTLQDVQASQSEAIQQGYQNACFNSAVTITAASGVSMTFPNDPATRQNIVNYDVVFRRVSPTPAAVPLQDASGATQMIANADLSALVTALFSLEATAWLRAQTLLAQIAAATTIEQVQQIQW